LSNIIKSRFIYLNGDDRKIIDSNERSEKIRLISLGTQRKNCAKTKEENAAEKQGAGTFTEGLMATVIDKISSEEEEEILKQHERIIEEAKEEAAKILTAARLDAEKESELIYEKARNKGYQDGIREGMDEVQEKQKELNQLVEKQKQDYLTQINNLEPQFAEIVAILVERITDTIVEDKKNVIHYLIHKAIMNADNNNYYNIRISKDDFEFVMSKKEELAILLKEEATITITLDEELDKNQCMIETDTSIIDCSLDVQLNNLIQDIKLLSIRKE